jgi:hypothetical protein
MRKEEEIALKTRIMYDQISIASRNCGKEEEKLMKEVNSKFSSIFNANNTVLEIFFQRFDTENPIRTMNQFITETSNKASIKLIYTHKEFCASQKKIMKDLTNIETKDFQDFVKKVITYKISDPSPCKGN